MPQTVEVPLLVKVTIDPPTPGETVDGEALVNVLKARDEARYTLGVAYPALKADIGTAADGFRDFAGVEALEQTAWNWMKTYRNVGAFHENGTDGSGEVVESYIYRGPDWTQISPVDGREYVIKAGDWLLGTVWTPDSWQAVKNRLINGYSPQGGARRAAPSPERLAELRN